MAKVSVIIPVYNAGRYLRRCLDSVCAQTLEDLQIILVNDSSTDDSLQILEEYAAKDPRITVVSQDNAGAGAARNHGLDLAQGEYLSFLDADDFFEPDMLEKAYDLAARQQDDFVVFRSDQFRQGEGAAAGKPKTAASSGGAAVQNAKETASSGEDAQSGDEEGTFVQVAWVVREEAIPPYQPFTFRSLTDNVFKVFVGWAWDKLYRRQFVLDHQLRFQEQRTSNDLLFVFSALVLAQRIGYLPDVLAHQRRDSKDSLSKTRENSWWCFHDALTALKDRLVQENLYEELEQDYINYCLHFTLWNYNSLAEPTKTTLKEKLVSEWFEQFGISSHGPDYYYNKGEYRQYLAIVEGTGAEPAHGKDQAGNAVKRVLRRIGRAIYDDTPVPVEGKTSPVQAWKVGAKMLQTEESSGKAGRADAPAAEGVSGEAAVSSHAGTASGQAAASPHAGAASGQTTASSHAGTASGQAAASSHGGTAFPKKTDSMTLRQEMNLVIAQNEALHQQVKALERVVRDHHDKVSHEAFVNGKKADAIQELISSEWNRRDDWPLRACDNARDAQGRPIWVIKCPAPDDESKIRWGDYPFAMSLKKNLEKLGIFAVVDLRQDWGAPEGAQVVIVLRGSTYYRPDRRGQNADVLYIMWNISHSDQISDYEYGLYDIVCVGSKAYAKELSGRISVPVYPLLQCTDTEIFCPVEPRPDPVRDYIFIGNSRGMARPCVMWAVEDHLPLRIWGSGWNTILKGHMNLIEAPAIENSRIPDLYRTSRVCLNDHWPDMLQRQFINNRIFDALACGLPVISDTCPELREIFPEAVLHYTDRSEFEQCVRRVREDYDAVKACVDEQFTLIEREYSFKARAKQLVDLVKEYRNE